MFYHAGALGTQAGYLGVDVFFVITGFLIAGIIIKQIEIGRFSSESFISDVQSDSYQPPYIDGSMESFDIGKKIAAMVALMERMAEGNPIWGRDDCRISGTVNETISRAVNLVLGEIANRTNATVKISADILCEGEYCQTMRDGVYQNRDRWHLPLRARK